MASLDTFAELLTRWRDASRPSERFAVVTQAASDLRGLSATDTRALAQGLLEHGAPLAAAQVARQAGHDASAEELTDVAQALLALDPGELGRFAEELHDPDTRERLVEQAAAWAAEGEGSEVDGPGGEAALPPPDVAARHDAAPPASTPELDEPPAVHEPAPADGEAHPLTAEVDAVPPADDAGAVETDPSPLLGTAATATQRREPPVDVTSLGQAIGTARTPRERWQVVDEAAAPEIDGAALRHLLDVVPDGWQRRTLLRRLLDARRIAAVEDPAAVVDAFARAGDRFAAAAGLVAAGLATPAQVSDLLRERDARRLQQRAA